MKLISCGFCGVVIDTDRITEPFMYDEKDNIIPENAVWCSWSSSYQPVIKCPACKLTIYFHDGDEA